MFNEDVVEASRNFVCIRLATYESQKEADYMAKLYTGKSGEVENTTFVILAPDGETKLTRAGRGPFVAYRNGSSMAKGLDRIAKKYKVKSSGTDVELPYADTARLGLNLAAADNQPLVVVYAEDSQASNSIEAKLVPLAWKEPAVGKFVFAKSSEALDLKSIKGFNSDEIELNCILLIEPDKFGQKGTLVARLDQSANQETIEAKLAEVSKNYRRIKKDHRSHVKAGIDQGVTWTSKIKVTDAQAEAARVRMRVRMRGESGERKSGRGDKAGRPDRDNRSSGSADRAQKFVEHAMKFDIDGDGKLNRTELEALAAELPSREKSRVEGRSGGSRERSGRRPPPGGDRSGGGRPRGPR